jgi:ubiquinol-cytochrome c reductase cytochrome b subunit
MGQMSFWGATVITNLVSVVPYVGEDLVLWIWGGYRINKARLSLFFLLHFLVPFIALVIVFFHLLLLHITRRTSPVFIHERFRKVKFYPFFVYKDILNISVVAVIFALVLFNPWILGDAENWLVANPIRSPVHIQPEWYFLFAYAILRCIPRKLGGVIALAIRVLVLPFLSFWQSYKTKRALYSKIFMVILGFRFFVLTWLGACPVEAPFILLRQIFRFIYFAIFLIVWL